MAEALTARESIKAADAHAPAAHIEHDTNTGISNTKLGMWLFLASECLLFGGLITTYLLYKRPLEGPTPKEIFDIPFTSTSSFVLLMSSLTMVLAVSAIERGDQFPLGVAPVAAVPSPIDDAVPRHEKPRLAALRKPPLRCFDRSHDLIHGGPLSRRCSASRPGPCSGRLWPQGAPSPAHGGSVRPCVRR